MCTAFSRRTSRFSDPRPPPLENLAGKLGGNPIVALDLPVIFPLSKTRTSKLFLQLRGLSHPLTTFVTDKKTQWEVLYRYMSFLFLVPTRMIFIYCFLVTQGQDHLDFQVLGDKPHHLTVQSIRTHSRRSLNDVGTLSNQTPHSTLCF